MHPGLYPSSAGEGRNSRLQIHRRWHSHFLPERDIVVYLPPGYEEDAERRYPVLYLHDGQNLFDPETSFIPGKTWQVRERADAEIVAGRVAPLIIVGIYHAGAQRLSEYTHIPDAKMGGGNADLYGNLIMRELIPFIDRTYRTRTNRDSTGMGGSSLGGLVTLYLGLKYPEKFGNLAVLSPAIWWSHQNIVEYVQKVAQRHPLRPRIWLDIGDAEGRRAFEEAELLHRKLAANGWRGDHDLHFELVRGGTHDETAWAGRVAPMLRFLFPA
ncbi:MAG TPA: alpha/beta hydrolase-fold protein [Acidisarcina sp.]|nr:alpha/beta hydrolase-fold protein [Acidisarcina sp.]